MLIAITNIVVLNGGDGAILFDMLRALRRAYGAEARFVVFASDPASARRVYPEVEFRETLGLAAVKSPRIRYIGRIVRALRASAFLLAAWCHARGWPVVARWMLGMERARDLKTYAEADLVISAGGTYLKEEYGMASQICDYRIALLLNSRLGFYTQTMGPFQEPRMRMVLGELFNAADPILLRDVRSREILSGLGVDRERLHVSPDAAFALADPEVLARAEHRVWPADRRLRVAVSVRHWPHFRGLTTSEGMARYRELMIGLTRCLLRDLDAEVTFLSTCQGNREYSDDSQTAQTIRDGLSPEEAGRVSVVHQFVRFDQLLSDLPHYDLVLATRMHMAILAMAAGTPALPLILEFKTEELYASLGLSQWVIAVQDFDVASARRTLLSFVEQLPRLRRPLFRRIEELRCSAEEAGQIFVSRTRTSAAPRPALQTAETGRD
jgi:colanic acid/amylovoran biosynthesis protein